MQDVHAKMTVAHEVLVQNVPKFKPNADQLRSYLEDRAKESGRSQLSHLNVINPENQPAGHAFVTFSDFMDNGRAIQKWKNGMVFKGNHITFKSSRDLDCKIYPHEVQFVKTRRAREHNHQEDQEPGDDGRNGQGELNEEEGWKVVYKSG